MRPTTILQSTGWILSAKNPRIPGARRRSSYNSLYPRDLSEGFPGGAEPLELRMRVAVRDAEKEMLTMIFNEVDAFTIDGPANCGGMERHITELVAVLSVLVPREDIEISYVEEVL